jgi:hypothetical protein
LPAEATADLDPAAVPRALWPRLARWIERRRINSDMGLGDTVHRLLTRFGGDRFSRLLEQAGLHCGCDRRQAWLNARFPY